jgi:hypothetical protein
MTLVVEDTGFPANHYKVHLDRPTKWAGLEPGFNAERIGLARVKLLFRRLDKG